MCQFCVTSRWGFHMTHGSRVCLYWSVPGQNTADKLTLMFQIMYLLLATTFGNKGYLWVGRRQARAHHTAWYEVIGEHIILLGSYREISNTGAQRCGSLVFWRIYHSVVEYLLIGMISQFDWSDKSCAANAGVSFFKKTTTLRLWQVTHMEITMWNVV